MANYDNVTSEACFGGDGGGGRGAGGRRETLNGEWRPVVLAS